MVFDGLESLFASSLESSLCTQSCQELSSYLCGELASGLCFLESQGQPERKRKKAEREKEELQWEKALQRNTEHILQMGEDEYDALPEETKAEVDKILQERKSTQTEGELKQPAQKLEEEAKALEGEERQKEEEKQEKEKGVSLGKQPAKPEKETKAPEKGAPKTSQKRGAKAPQKRGTRASGKWETKVPEDPAEILMLRFQIYESSQQDIAQVFSCGTGFRVPCSYLSSKSETSPSLQLDTEVIRPGSLRRR
ncbi:uncharacterized protein GJ701_003804 [Geothlypis trichas]